ncbi:MAG: acyl-CoA dehydrogenase family protein [Myxococcota bacterium]|nr:acyl-CoA dehydrogenase family protein [Myxococcota bacterium]
MNFAFNEDQDELRATARAFLADHSGSAQVRAAMESELGHDPQVWKQIAMELGWAAVAIPEAYGGLGLGAVEVTALVEVMGESLLCVPFFSSVCLGASALVVAGTEEQKQEHLPRIAEGECIATLAHAGPSEAIAVRFRPEADGASLSGAADFVVDGCTADLLIVAAQSENAEDVALFVVPGDADGLARTVQPTLDQTRRLASVRFDNVRLPASARMSGGEDSLQEILDRARIALAAEQVGGAQRCLDLAVAYAKEREQFGRPIGSFQAIKHKCANMMIEIESARSAAYYAACAAAEGSDELPIVASLAKAYCSDTYFQCAAECLQIHGGVGFTWEYDVHLYLKRARSSETLLGDPSYHRERVAGLIGL